MEETTQQTNQEAIPGQPLDWAALVDDLNRLLRLKTTVIGMKLYQDEAALAGVKGLRRPKATHTTDQIVGMAARLGWTVGITGDDLVGAQCRAVIGLGPQDEAWRSGKEYVGVWHATEADARARQEALSCVPAGRYRAMVVSPLASGRLDPPDICLVYATPGQMIILINGLQWKNYRRFDWSVVGETACADSWGAGAGHRRAQPVLALLCRAPLRRRAGRGNADGAAAALPAHGDRGNEGLVGQWPALPDSAVWHPERRARRHGRELRAAAARLRRSRQPRAPRLARIGPGPGRGPGRQAPASAAASVRAAGPSGWSMRCAR